MTNLLTPRLLAVASRVPRGARIADIGTDHAYVPVYLIQNDIAISAVASDINTGPAQRAERNIKKHSLADKIRVCVADGMRGLQPNEADTVIIAGMGGRLIAEILSDGDLAAVHTLVLQPMTEPEYVRRWLYVNGWTIEDEVLAAEGEKIYLVIKASCPDPTFQRGMPPQRQGDCTFDIPQTKTDGRGQLPQPYGQPPRRGGTPQRRSQCPAPTDIDLTVYCHTGTKLLEKKDPLLKPLAQRELARLQRAVKGMAKSQTKNENQTLYLALINRYKEIFAKL